jgi:hypothetical protein
MKKETRRCLASSLFFLFARSKKKKRPEKTTTAAPILLFASARITSSLDTHTRAPLTTRVVTNQSKQTTENAG